MSAKLSTVMQAAVDHARENGGKLCRYPGGFWMKPGLDWQATERGSLVDGVWFGTTTVQALIQRKAAEVSKWNQNARGKFAVEITII